MNLDAILLDQEEEAQPEHHTLEDRLKEGRGERQAIKKVLGILGKTSF